jgi:mRNA interferase MazF
VLVGVHEGLKHDSAIHCDELISIPKSLLTHYIGKLPYHKLTKLKDTLLIALDVED